MLIMLKLFLCLQDRINNKNSNNNAVTLSSFWLGKQLIFLIKL